MKHKSILLALIALLPFSCQEADLDSTIMTDFGFDTCLKPVGVYTEVHYTDVTLHLKTFPDAKNYVLELYTDDASVPKDEFGCFATLTIAKDSIPYTFKTLEEKTISYRVKATSPDKKDSKWTYGDSFKTGTDPSTTCVEPKNVVATAIFQKFNLSWSVTPEVQQYELEFYNAPIPDEGEPSSTSLVESHKILPTAVPFQKKFTSVGKLYYRLRSTAPTTGLKSSKWVKGSFQTEVFTWPTDPEAITTTWVDNEDDPMYKTIANRTEEGMSKGHNKDTVVLGKMHYAPDCYFVGDRVTTSGKGVTTTDYGQAMPTTKRYMWFKICKPGKFTATYRSSASSGVTIVLFTNKKGEGKKSIWVFDDRSIPKDNFKTDGIRTAEITEDMLYGITEAAEVRIFDSGNQAIQVYPPLKWDPTQVSE